MSYKFSKGSQVIGDLRAADDTQRDTLIDFGEDYIGFETSGSVRMVISGSSGSVGIGTTTPDYTLDVAGDIGVNQYIYHNGDGNTWINFSDNRIRLNAGGNNFIDCQDNPSAPHKVRINNGGNNIDFVIKDKDGNVYFTADASTSKVGIGTDTPSHKLDIDGDIRIRGNDIRDNSGNPAITFDGSTNTSFAGSVTSTTLGFTGSLNGTASAAVKDQIGETIVGGVYEIDQGIFQNPHSSFNPIYFPSDDSFTERVGPSSVNFFIAPFNGELIQIQLRSTGSFIGKQLTASLHVGVDGNNAYSSTPATSLVLNGQGINTTYTFDFTSAANTTFSAGNIYGFSLGIGGGFDGDETFRFTTVVKFNPYA